MPKKAGVCAFVLLPCLLLAGVAYAHDMWLRPASFRLAPGDTLNVHQLVGHDLEAETEVALLRTMTPRFELLTPDTTIDLLAGLPDMRTQPVILPVLERQMDVEGPALVAMDHAFIHNEFSTEEFVEYLHHEAYTAEDFQDRIGQKASQTERYARMFKALVQVGEADRGDLHARALGQKLEILLLQNPYRLGIGDSLDVRVLFDGQPLAGARLSAYNGEPKHHHGGQEHHHAASHAQARTDADGVARFALDHEGFWLLRLVHLYPAPVSDVDWESYWASYTFWVD